MVALFGDYHILTQSRKKPKNTVIAQSGNAPVLPVLQQMTLKKNKSMDSERFKKLNNLLPLKT